MNNSKVIMLKSIFISTLLIVMGCNSKIYNTPYINTIETMELDINLSKNEVISMLGKPLYVEYGSQTNSEVSWVYEVRAREVKSNLSINTDEIVPNKDHHQRKPGQPIHHLRVIFIDSKVSRWQILDKKKEEEAPNVDLPKNEKKLKFPWPQPKKIFFQPKIGFGYNSDMNGITYGISTGYVIDEKGGSIGIDMMRFGEDDGTSGAAAMLIYNKLYKQVFLQGGIGYSWIGNLNTLGFQRVAGLSLGFGIGYKLQFTKYFFIMPSYDINIGIGGHNGVSSRFSGINLNLGWGNH